MINSLYVHIPFCNSICSYCDFCRVKYNSRLVDTYLDELSIEAKRLDQRQFKTIYVGGGTPTSLNLIQLKKLLEVLKNHTNDIKEYTFEANPESLTEDKIKLLKEYNVNRISLGVQTFDSDLLKIINRHHSENDVINAINLLRKNNINNISIDLIYGLPFQNIYSFLSSVEKVIELKIPHLSFYNLTIEEHSEFKRLGYKEQETDITDEMYFKAIELLEKANYHQYEISNFALDNYESQHNKTYWLYQDFEAIGLNASGKVKHQRFTNTNNFVDYFNHKYKKEIIDLTIEDEYFETIMMGLRLKNGIELKNEIFNYYQKEINELIEKEILELYGKKLRVNKKYYYFLNDVLLYFMR